MQDNMTSLIFDYKSLIIIMKCYPNFCKTAKSRHIPKNISKFNKRKHLKEKWMTR